MAYIINPIPGHVYIDNTGTQLLFLGIGTYKRVNAADPSDRNYWWHSGAEPKHLYIKKADLDTKLADGRLHQNLLEYNGRNKPGCTTDFFKTIFFSNKPRKLVSDLGELYSINTFKNRTITDYTYDKPILWVINTL